jgi:hypothetical protein
MAVTVGNVQNLCTSGTKERKERVRRGMKQRRRKRRIVEGKKNWM